VTSDTWLESHSALPARFNVAWQIPGLPRIRTVQVSKIRIVVADDHEEMLSLIKELLQPEFEVVATVRNGRDLLDAVKNFKPDVIIIDISMPGMSGIEATMRIVEEDPDARIILVSMYNHRSMLEEGISAGAKGYVYKLAAGRELVPAVYEVAEGGFYISPLVKQ
jgi:DNA-binding NarL/FixJ family response regulator